MDNIWRLSIIMETWSGDAKAPILEEQVKLDSTGVVTHRRRKNGLLVVDRQLPVTDRAAMADFGGRMLGDYRITKWENKYQVTESDDERLKLITGGEYRTWRMEYRRGERRLNIYGDVEPERARQFRDDVLALTRFEPVPELFFITADGTGTLPTAEELLARL